MFYLFNLKIITSTGRISFY